MRKYFKMLTIAIVGFIILSANGAYGDYICGDANSDGTINVSDAVWIINFVFIGGPAPYPFCLGDANHDHQVNVSDAVYIINYVFIGGTAPIPNCCVSCPSTVTDIDGNIYQTVLIGDQCWMKENLKVIHYRNGDVIPNVTDNTAWGTLTTGAYCDYGSIAVYGRLYNFYAVDDGRNIAPQGWHVPTDAEWKQLEIYLGMSQAAADGIGFRGTDEGGKLKEAGTAHWQAPNSGATNSSSFTALPGGIRLYTGLFDGVSFYENFWTSTPSGDAAWIRNLSWISSQVKRTTFAPDGKRFGLRVRCVKD